MADYRQIHTKIWTDGWFLDLSAKDKLLFIYLFSNKRACLIGLYDIPLKVIEFETDLTRQEIEEGIARFEEAGKVAYQDGWIWIPNLMRYNAKNIQSPKIQAHIRSTINDVSDNELKQRWITHYNGIVDAQYRIHTISIPNLHEQEQEQEQEQEHSADADAPPPPDGIPDPSELTVKEIQALKLSIEQWRTLQECERHGRNRSTALRFMRSQLNPTAPAVQVYRGIAETTPVDAICSQIAGAVGTSETDLDFWRKVVTGYIAHGWNKYNVSNMLDFYKRREIPGNGRPPPGQQPAKGLDASKEAIRQWAASKGEILEATDGDT